MVDVPMVSGDSIPAWVVCPERADEVASSSSTRSTVSATGSGRRRQLAAEGFIAVAPDLISGLGPGAAARSGPEPRR
jgi:hypothetical protein